jgi:PhoH-like ATPase
MSVPDNVILATALFMSAVSLEQDMPCILVSKDVNVRIKCDSIGVTCQDYMNNRVTVEKEQFYRGVDTFDDPKWSTLIEELYSHSPKDPIDLPREMLEEHVLYPNQILVVKDGGQSSVITRVLQSDAGNWSIERLTEYKDVMGLKPRNKEQNFVLNLLLDPSVCIVTMTSKSGCGKTLVSLAAGLDQLVGLGSRPKYEKLIVTRPIQSVGKDLGYLPGNLQEKMDPWISPIKDNLNFLMGYKKPKEGQRIRRNQDQNSSASSTDVEPYIAMLMDSHKIEIEAIPYIRGRSIPNSYIIIDEAQNLSIHELKTIITRSGEGTKMILLGDVEQIDHPLLDIYTNGLSHAVEKFKTSNLSGHVTLRKGERSALSTLASNIL